MKTCLFIISLPILFMLARWYLDGAGKSAYLKTQGVELPWYYAASIQVTSMDSRVRANVSQP